MGLSQPRRFHVLRAWRTLVSDDAFVLGLSAGGWIDVRQGATEAHPHVVVQRSGPETQLSCQEQ